MKNIIFLIIGAILEWDCFMFAQRFNISRWIHVVYIFDSNFQKISLYNNGILTATQNVLFNSIGLSGDKFDLYLNK